MSAPWVDPLDADELAEEASREAADARHEVEVDEVLVGRYVELIEASFLFPADPGCYGCRGTGFLQGFGSRPGTVCPCRRHSPECEPLSCSSECHRLAVLRGEM